MTMTRLVMLKWKCLQESLRESQAHNSAFRVPLWSRNNETRVSESLWAVNGHMAEEPETRDTGTPIPNLASLIFRAAPSL